MKLCFFFFNDTATTEIYTLSLHDALPISIGDSQRQVSPHRRGEAVRRAVRRRGRDDVLGRPLQPRQRNVRSEEHTSELQSQSNLVCRLLLEKKKLLPRAYTRLATCTPTTD